jgi:hypothetical protein
MPVRKSFIPAPESLRLTRQQLIPVRRHDVLMRQHKLLAREDKVLAGRKLLPARGYGVPAHRFFAL